MSRLFIVVLCSVLVQQCLGYCEVSDNGSSHYDCDTLEDLVKISKKHEAITIVVKHQNTPYRCSMPIFQDFPKTRQIRIQEGSFITVGQNCFIGLYEIDEIDLKYNRITDFDATSLNGSTIAWLILSGNHLTSINFKGLVLPKLRHLILSKNKLNTLIVDSTNFPTLVDLSVDNNEISSFQIINNEVYSIRLSENKIRTFYADNLKAENLHFLSLERNLITEIHYYSIKNLPKLKEIRLEGNLVDYVDFASAEINKFKITENSIIFHKERKEEPLTIYLNWTRANRVVLSSNKIKSFDTSRFVDNNIEELKLDYNLIETIKRDDFHIFNNLLMLDLSSNKISSIHFDAFNALKNLHTLNLNNNCIQSLAVSALDSLASIVNINLSHNLLTHFPIPGWNNQTQEVRMDGFHPILSVQELTLSHNPLQCSCYHLLLDWTKRLQNYQMLKYNLFDNSDLTSRCMETNQRCRSHFNQQLWANLVPEYLRKYGRESVYRQCDTRKYVNPSERPRI